MVVEAGNNWPLMVVTNPGDKVLQKGSTPHLTSQNPQGSAILDNMIGSEPDIFLEKGKFVDIYI